jgi:hypothetical protein
MLLLLLLLLLIRAHVLVVTDEQDIVGLHGGARVERQRVLA